MRYLVMFVLLLAAFAARAQTLRAEPLLDAGAVPNLSAAGQASYAAWLLTNTPRVFATDGHGKTGWVSGGGSLDAARQRALDLCAQHGGVECRPYAEDLDIVWPGREWRAPAAPAPLVDTWNWGLFPDRRFLWHGPGTAAGVVLWGHGKAGDRDARGLQPPSFLRGFNDAGFDIVRFDRAPIVDTTLRAQGWLQDGLRRVRSMGYRVVVAAGQSRGGWNALQMLDTAGLADAVIAISPAAQGSGASTNLTAQDDELRGIVAAAPAAPSRLAFVQFQQDPFASSPEERVRLVGQLRARLGGLLIIDQPEGITGHFGAETQAFSQRYGACLLRFVTAPTPQSGCGGAEQAMQQ